MGLIKATKKPVTIQALKWDKTGRCQREMAEFVPFNLRRTDYKGCGVGDCPELYLITLEGEMHVKEGDYVIKGIEGEFYPCKPEIFEKRIIFRRVYEQ